MGGRLWIGFAAFVFETECAYAVVLQLAVSRQMHNLRSDLFNERREFFQAAHFADKDASPRQCGHGRQNGVFFFFIIQRLLINGRSRHEQNSQRPGG